MVGKLRHVKADFLSFLARSISPYWSEKPRRYSCLKFTFVNWKVANKKQKALFQLLSFAFWSPFAFWTFKTSCSPFLQLVKGSPLYKGAFACKEATLWMNLNFELWKLSPFLFKFLVLYLECLVTSSGSLGLLNSTKKVINFCNLVEGRRLPKCANQGGSSITLASSLVSILVLGYFGSIFALLPKCILVSLFLNLALVKLEYIS